MSLPLIAGRDFYVENGYYVFTADYLQRRGHCCASGCRHCPYGFAKSADSATTPCIPRADWHDSSVDPQAEELHP